MREEVAIPVNVHDQARELLLQHFYQGSLQEDLCFGLWRQSTGAKRKTSIIYEIIPPNSGERKLHGNVSFTANYLTRAVRIAYKKKAGLVFMHNHLKPGWQDMSRPDVVAERDRISPLARVTGFPLLGLTLGTDESWSARLWMWNGERFYRVWCDKVRVVGKGLHVTFNDDAVPVPPRRKILQRTFDTWGLHCQNNLVRLRIGVVGVGSVGTMVAEILARIGVGQLILIDHDRVQEHNLDRLLYAGIDHVGQNKVDVASEHLRHSSTAEQVDVQTYAQPIENETAFLAALDCDILFSAVDRSLPKDVINRIAYVHCIPVISGGVFVDNKDDETLGQASWSVTTVGPGHRCLRCDGQYTSSDVVLERDGSFDDPAYVANLQQENGPRNQNVFPFSVNLASFMVLQMIRLIMSENWWPPSASKLHYTFIPNQLKRKHQVCDKNCSIEKTEALGDHYCFPYINKV